MAKENIRTRRSFWEIYILSPNSGQEATPMMWFLCSNMLTFKIILGIGLHQNVFLTMHLLRCIRRPPEDCAGGNLKIFLYIIPKIAGLCPSEESILFRVQNYWFGFNFPKGMFLDLISFAQESNCCFLLASFVKEVFWLHNLYVPSRTLYEGKFVPVL